jgi:hypothetical protein
MSLSVVGDDGIRLDAFDGSRDGRTFSRWRAGWRVRYEEAFAPIG